MYYRVTDPKSNRSEIYFVYDEKYKVVSSKYAKIKELARNDGKLQGNHEKWEITLER